MLKQLFLLILISSLLFACSKGSYNSNANSYKIEYQLTSTNATNINVIYHDMVQSAIGVSNLSSLWNVNFTITFTPYVAFLSATADPINAAQNVNVTLKILVNGAVAKSQDFVVSGSFSGQILYGF